MADRNSWLLVVLMYFELATILAGQGPPPQAPVPPSGLTIEVLDHMKQLPGGLSVLPGPSIPQENPQTQAKIDLGRMLFLDKRLSLDGSISCSSCHDPAKAYSDGRPKAVGVNHTVLSRRSPSLLNAAYNHTQFWDGRAKSLEEQALAPMLSRNEMGIPDPDTLLLTLRNVPEYRRRFRTAFDRPINLEDIARAIAAFERTLITRNSAFDRYAGGDKRALTEQQKRGLILFIGKASCTQCHNGANFTDNKFHSLGILPGPPDDIDVGHFVVSKNPVDRHAFKTPSLRSATEQSSYMHNGSIPTLAKVIEFYDRGGGEAPKSKLMFQLHLTAAEKDDLLAFLHSLAGQVPIDRHLPTK